MDQEELNEVLEKHKKWFNGEEVGKRADLGDADLRYADLRYADLRDADLRYADLGDADLDFSCWPLWCGSKGVKVDLKIVYQLLAHVCAVDCDEPEFAEIRNAIKPYAIKSHRAKDLGVE